MKMIAQNAEKVQMASKISHFMKGFRVGDLLKACNAYKEKGVSVVRLFVYMLQMHPELEHCIQPRGLA